MRFLAVHGGCHGAWCWDLLKPELESLGHELVAVELPGHGTRVDEVATLDGYRQAVLDELRAGDVLVGHSSGGVIAVLAANERPDLVSHLCLVASLLPVEGQPLPYETASVNLGVGDDEAGADEPDGALDEFTQVIDDGRAFVFTRQGAIAAFYHDCSPEVVDWAFPQLVPEPLEPLSVPISVPAFWASDIPRSFIAGTLDPTCPPALAHSQAKRLGVIGLEIESSHSPFLSRPAELAQLLVDATRTHPVGPLIPTSARELAREG